MVYAKSAVTCRWCSAGARQAPLKWSARQQDGVWIGEAEIALGDLLNHVLMWGLAEQANVTRVFGAHRLEALDFAIELCRSLDQVTTRLEAVPAVDRVIPENSR